MIWIYMFNDPQSIRNQKKMMAKEKEKIMSNLIGNKQGQTMFVFVLIHQNECEKIKFRNFPTELKKRWREKKTKRINK